MIKFNSSYCFGCILKIMFFLAIALCSFYVLANLYEYIQPKLTLHSSVELLHLAIDIILPAIIAWIAYTQLKKIENSARGDFLQRLDNSFNDTKIQKVLFMIYDFERESKCKCPAHNLRDHICSDCDKAVTQDLKDRITKIWFTENAEDKRKRFNISFYLDHLETLSYFVNVEYISFEDIKNLHGDIISYASVIFKEWIKYAAMNSPDAYVELIKLSKKLNEAIH